MNEQRRYPRIEKSLSLKLSDSEFDVVTETKNISGNGVYCAIDKPLEPMTKLNIIILIPLRKNKNKTIKKIHCEGVVVRKEYVRNNAKFAYHVGIYFNEIKEYDRKLLLSYINAHLKALELTAPTLNS